MITVALVAILVIVATAASVVGLRSSSSTDAAMAGLDNTTRVVARDFLDTYVEPDGRVVRTDQGGDTVSEGQAYALLLAVGIGDQRTFDRVWQWTRSTLQRSDGLLSWRFDDGAVVDQSSAADADIDVARALAVAAARFDNPAYADAGRALGTAILDHETIATPDGLVLVAGQWATGQPALFNPSYVSPVATSMLAELTGDPRWDQLTAGSRAAVEAITPEGRLPPDWAEVSSDGSVRPVSGPAGAPVQFGYDAARTLLRHAESCVPADRAVARDSADVLGKGEAVAVYDLAGSPQTTNLSPLTLVAQAAGRAAGGDSEGARTGIAAAMAASADTPTYYGDAWAALGSMLLSSDVLGSCPAAPSDSDSGQ